MKLKKTPLIQLQSSGFSLIELMVVVSIIAVLAAIALPAFNAYQNKARQSEAKIALSGIYQAILSYSAVSQAATSCIGTIGVTPPDAVHLYSVGFVGASVASPGIGDGTCIDGDMQAGTGQTHYLVSPPGTLPANITPTVTADLNAITASAVGGGALANGTAVAAAPTNFVAKAVGRITPGAAATVDVWSIDHLQNLVNNQAGF